MAGSSLTHDELHTAVTRYLEMVASGTSADIAELYSEDAVLEDPAGSIPHHGRAAIQQFYEAITGLNRSTELLDFRAASSTVAFRFSVVIEMPGMRVTTEPIDVMTFNDEGLITAMRAIWSEENVHTESTK